MFTYYLHRSVQGRTQDFRLGAGVALGFDHEFVKCICMYLIFIYLHRYLRNIINISLYYSGVIMHRNIILKSFENTRNYFASQGRPDVVPRLHGYTPVLCKQWRHVLAGVTHV